MHLFATAMEIEPEILEKLRGLCVREIKKTNGSISLKDVVEYQKGADRYQAALALAAAQLTDIGPERYESTRIRRLLEGKRQTDLTPTLIRQITAKILLGPTGAIAVKLKNGQILGKEPQS